MMLEAVRIRPVIRSELGYLLASIRGRPWPFDGAAARVATCSPAGWPLPCQVSSPTGLTCVRPGRDACGVVREWRRW